MAGSDFDSIWTIGPTEVALILGRPFSQYRPASAGAAIAPENLLNAAFPVWVTGDDKLMAAKPFNREKPDNVYAGLDPTATMIGDYLVGNVVLGGDTLTFFVASQDVPMPIRLVYCARVLDIYEPEAPAPGAGYYGGNVGGLGAPKMTGWPASVVIKSRGEMGSVKLPGDVKSPWFEVMLPAFAGVQIKMNDVIIDDNLVRYQVSSAELTYFGWRAMAWQTTT
jgi:hypothetical protein